MTSVLAPVLADTHTFIWYVQGDPRLSASAKARLQAAGADGSTIFISAMTAVELFHLADKGTLSDDEHRHYLGTLDLQANNFEIAPVDLDVARAVDAVPRALVADPFDRIIAATSVALGVPLVTADKKLRDLPAVETIW